MEPICQKSRSIVKKRCSRCESLQIAGPAKSDINTAHNMRGLPELTSHPAADSLSVDPQSCLEVPKPRSDAIY